MTIAGIIAEYDPFHKGHAWHIAETRRATGCDFVAVCMDGHFTQRGEPALWSKWARAAAALRCGADAVFELPALYAVRPADAFARGGVGILGGLGVDCLSFGCETGDLSVIEALAGLHEDEPACVSARVREGLARGLTHSRAWGEAVEAYLGVDPNRPNLILAAEYVRAIRAQGSRMVPVPIPRRGDYHGGVLEGFASASAIRSAFMEGRTGEALDCLPDAARAVPDLMHPMDDLLTYILRGMSLDDMAALPDVSEGLEHRLYRLCRTTSTREGLLDAMKCKRYTRARLSRMLTHAALGMTRELVKAHPMPPYARLLGMKKDAGPLLKELTRRAALPIVSDLQRLRDDPVFRLECRATDFWGLLHDEAGERVPGREMTERFIVV